MKNILISILLLFTVSYSLTAQDTLTVYYDQYWQVIAGKKDAAFYRKAIPTANNSWKVWDYYMNNTIQMTGAFKTRKFSIKQGYFVYYYENGGKSAEGKYVNNWAEGPWIYWYENGRKKSEGECKENQEVGTWIYWNEDGTKKCEGTYSNGYKLGTWTYWRPDGKVFSKETYAENGSFKYEEFYENGALKLRGNFENENPQGPWVYWNCDGRVIMKGSFLNGRREGEWVRLFPDSEMKLNFKYGLAEGKELGGMVR